MADKPKRGTHVRVYGIDGHLASFDADIDATNVAQEILLLLQKLVTEQKTEDSNVFGIRSRLG